MFRRRKDENPVNRIQIVGAGREEFSRSGGRFLFGAFILAEAVNGVVSVGQSIQEENDIRNWHKAEDNYSFGERVFGNFALNHVRGPIAALSFIGGFLAKSASNAVSDASDINIILDEKDNVLNAFVTDPANGETTNLFSTAATGVNDNAKGYRVMQMSVGEFKALTNAAAPDTPANDGDALRYESLA